ncbi:nuclear transport factor 2 family protein [Krasilnikovia sp. MM14-A1259]|uniref:nuclear transport factor 2 family protein n=1 Tax=Krasilnikovia sp. MM14-A1259 TaxID=3373539 RepID=UPI00383094A5
MNDKLPTAVADFFGGSRTADPDAWARPLADDALIHDPVGQPPFTGRVAFCERITGFLPHFSRFDGLTPTNAYHGGASVAVHWRATANTATGRELAWTGITVFTLDDHDKICQLRGYFDPSIFA